jgi:hypothetical protein
MYTHVHVHASVVCRSLVMNMAKGKAAAGAWVFILCFLIVGNWNYELVHQVPGSWASGLSHPFVSFIYFSLNVKRALTIVCIKHLGRREPICHFFYSFSFTESLHFVRVMVMINDCDNVFCKPGKRSPVDLWSCFLPLERRGEEEAPLLLVSILVVQVKYAPFVKDELSIFNRRHESATNTSSY